jgi:hypothetical protein
MIVRDDVLAPLTEACPGIVARLRAADDLDEELPYIAAASFARALLARLDEDDDEVDAAFRSIERLHIEGDHYVRELATIGFLESLHTPENPALMAACERRLGPESRRWWRGLIAFWTRRAPFVVPVDD